jgi:hypothetical protein
VKRSIRILPFVVAAAVALAAAGTGSTAQAPALPALIAVSFGATPTLDIITPTASSGSGGGLISVGISSGSGSGSSLPSAPPAQVSIDLAAGFTLAPAAPGSQIGLALLTSSSGDSQTPGSFAGIGGLLTSVDPSTYATDPASLACAPGPYIAVWKLNATVLGLSFEMPFFLEHPVSDPQAIEIRFCVPPLTGADGKPVTQLPVPLDSAEFILAPIVAPQRAGSHTSRALVTAQTPTGSPDPGSTVEARFVDPQPHSLAVKGRYDKRTHDAVLTGRVKELGKAQRNAHVQYLRTDTLDLPKSVRTSATGSFRINARIAAPTTFLLQVPDAVGACPGASSAPKGCVSLTTAGTNSSAVLVRPSG